MELKWSLDISIYQVIHVFGLEILLIITKAYRHYNWL